MTSLTICGKKPSPMLMSNLAPCNMASVQGSMHAEHQVCSTLNAEKVDYSTQWL